MSEKRIIFLILKLLTIGCAQVECNYELVISLQQHFRSDMIFITSNADYAKKLYKLQNFKAFIGAINLKDRFLVRNFKKEMIIPYRNILVVFYFSAETLNGLTNFYPLSTAQVIWVCFTDRDVADDIKGLYIPYNSKFFLIKRRNASEYEITDIYQICENSPKIYSNFGTFENGQLKVAKESFYYRRRDLKGHEFNISLSYFPEYTKKFGYLWELFNEGMNFSVFSNYTGSGTIGPNGTSTGIFKLLSDRKIDGTAINYVVTNQRLDVFDSIFPTIICKALMYVNLQTELNWTSYLAPFSLKVWISIAAWIMFFAAILHIIIRSKPHPERSYMDSVFDMMQAICYQGGNFNYSSSALCILYLTPYLLAIILVQYYSGQLLSYLTVKNVNLPFKNLKEAIDDGRYKVTAMKTTFYENYFRTNEGPEATAIREKGLLLSTDQMPTRNSAGFHQLCDGRYLYISASAIDTLVIENCHIEELKEVIFYESWGILVWKGFPYKNDLTKLMRQIQFSGLVKLDQNNIIIPKSDTTHFQPLSLDQIFPIFLLYLAVILISGLILLCEINWNRHKLIEKASPNDFDR